MNITARDISYKRKVGKLDGKDVIEIGTKGGLHLLVMAKGGSVETLAAGPHRAVARHIAKRRNKDLVFTELAKSEHVEEAAYAHYLPEYEALTDTLRRLG